MKKELEDYAPLYLGCNVLISQNGVTNKLVSIVRNSDEEIILGTAIMLKVKLILRHLSDMTDEEAIECGNLDYDFSDDPDLNKWTWKDFDTLNSSNQFLFLLSKHFDLFGLIEAGLAIDKKTLK